jgi:hypothetical protein
VKQTQAWITVGIVALAVAVRIAAVLALQSHRVPRSTYEHGEIAANLLAGRGFSARFLGAEGPTSQQAPVYPVIVAFAYAIGGAGTPFSLLLLELGQAVLGGCLALGAVRLGCRVAPSRPLVGLSAGLIVAVYPTLVYAATHVQVALLAATLLCWMLSWAYRTGVTGQTGDAIVTGGMLALGVLADPILALSVAGLVWAIVQERRLASPTSWTGETTRLLGCVTLAAVVGITPWMIRNWLVHGEFVPIKSTLGYAFWQGNCAQSEGTDKVVRATVERALQSGAGGGLSELNRTLWTARHEAGYLDDVALSRDDLKMLGSVPEPERSRLLFRRATRELNAEPGRYLNLCLRRWRYFWLFDETNPKTRVAAYRVCHLALTVAAIVGLAAAQREVRARLLPTMAVALAIALFHTLTIVSARFHIPIEPLLALWAAAGLTAFPPWPSSDFPCPSVTRTIRVSRGWRPHRMRRARRLAWPPAIRLVGWSRVSERA